MSKKDLITAKSLPNTENMTVLEVGPYKGQKTRVLSKYFKSVLALEGRQQNLDDCPDLPNVEYKLFDVSNLTVNDFGRFDLVFHSGVFYHLPNPKKHLRNVCQIADNLLLDTHYSLPQDGHSRHYEEQDKGRRKTGLVNYSYWITKKKILAILESEDFNIEVTRDKQMHKTGFIKPRFTLLATKR